MATLRNTMKSNIESSWKTAINTKLQEMRDELQAGCDDEVVLQQNVAL